MTGIAQGEAGLRSVSPTGASPGREAGGGWGVRPAEGEGRSLQGRWYGRLAESPLQHAVAFVDARGQVSWRTREDLHRSAAGYASALHDLGAREGDVCVLVLPSNELCATLLLGVLLAGAVPLLVAPPVLQGVNSQLPLVIRRAVTRTRARVVVVSDSQRAAVAELAARARGTRIVTESELRGTGSPLVTPVSPPPGAVAALQLTSGTTGFPRICAWRQSAVCAALDTMTRGMALRADDVCLNWTPLYHDMGLVNNFFLCLAQGVPLVLLNPTDFVKQPALWLRALASTGATLTWSPNFGFALAAQRVQDSELEGVDLRRVRAFWNAAERIHLETMQAFHTRFERFGVTWASLKTNFGCAENVGGATFSDPRGPLVAELVDRQALHAKRVARPMAGKTAGEQTVWVVGVGRPSPGIRLQILSPRGRTLPDGRVGEVALETPSRMSGYLGDRVASSRAVMGSWLRTGDLGYSRGGELFWVGRVRERITVRGRKLDPSDFEEALRGVPDLREGCFAAFGVDDGDRGTQRVIVASEIRQPASRPYPETANLIRDRVYLRLGVPADAVLLFASGTLTKTSSGKRRHRYFRQLYLDGQLQLQALFVGGE